jgi:hypothetical protein
VAPHSTDCLGGAGSQDKISFFEGRFCEIMDLLFFSTISRTDWSHRLEIRSRSVGGVSMTAARAILGDGAPWHSV